MILDEIYAKSFHQKYSGQVWAKDKNQSKGEIRSLSHINIDLKYQDSSLPKNILEVPPPKQKRKEKDLSW